METFKQTFKNWSKFEEGKIYKLSSKLASDEDVLRLTFNRYNTIMTDIDKYMVAECPGYLYLDEGSFTVSGLYLIKDPQGMALIGDAPTLRKAQKDTGLQFLDQGMEYLESLTD